MMSCENKHNDYFCFMIIFEPQLSRHIPILTIVWTYVQIIISVIKYSISYFID